MQQNPAAACSGAQRTEAAGSAPVPLPENTDTSRRDATGTGNRRSPAGLNLYFPPLQSGQENHDLPSIFSE